MRAALQMLSRTAPQVASRVAADLFMTPRRFSPTDRERALLAGAVPFEVRLGATQSIQAWRWGAGPAVVLVHGWEGRGSQLAPMVPPLVEAGFSVVTYDAPGHGLSAGSRSSLPHFTYALRGVAGHVGDVHAVIAHSFGCAATTLALRDGLALRCAVFVAPPLNPADYTARFGDMFGLGEDVVEGLRLRIEERFMRSWSDYSLAHTARAMSTPLLVIHDREDAETPWSGGATLADAWPGATLHTTEGLGHRRILREPSVVAAAAHFIARAAPPLHC
jgi:pimeloyl-ACP methyl ester carboxylesterase